MLKYMALKLSVNTLHSTVTQALMALRWRTDTVLVFPDYRTVCMSPDLLGLER